ncbi:uncharacterized protein [Primulina huaijiensis]|uniref:uncharacterized protein n=1 Tax=Primulina huaijiensis TaxID=1492673 RepID=UPI003CC72315
MWALSDNYLELITNKWDIRYKGTTQFRLKQQLNGLKNALKSLNRTQFGNISYREEAVCKNLVGLQNNILQDGITCDNYHVVRKGAERLLEAERLFLAQKAKCSYLKQGDRCTKFFHDLIKRNNKRNDIVAIKKSDGGVTINQEDIVNEFIIFYRNLLGSKEDRIPLDRSLITEGHCFFTLETRDLTAMVTLDEVKDALFDIDNDKALGSDGYGSFFFKSSWNIISNDVFAAVKEFFSSGRLLKQ